MVSFHALYEQHSRDVYRAPLRPRRRGLLDRRVRDGAALASHRSL